MGKLWAATCSPAFLFQSVPIGGTARAVLEQDRSHSVTRAPHGGSRRAPTIRVWTLAAACEHWRTDCSVMPQGAERCYIERSGFGRQRKHVTMSNAIRHSPGCSP